MPPFQDKLFQNQPQFDVHQHIGPDRNHQPVACYLPIAGDDGLTAYAAGYYWSTTEGSSSYAYYWNLGSGSASISSYYKTNGYSVRCVRSVAQGEVAQAPRASHAWVRASTGEEDGWSWSNPNLAGRRA